MAVKIDDVLHEFSSVQGVVEDVADIILNLKEVRLKYYGEGAEIVRIDSEGEGEVKAGDIAATEQVEILNPEHHIASMSKDGALHMEMTVNLGKGYIPADRNQTGEQSIGTIPMDAIFSPI